MASDPVIFNPQTEPGKVKHSLTGLRITFPNAIIHQYLNTYYKPFRTLLMTISASRGQGPIPEPTITKLQSILQESQEYLQRNADQVSAAPMASLKARQATMAAFRQDMLSKDLDALIGDPKANFADYVQIPSFIVAQTVSFDYEGKTNPNFAQPTDGRIKNTGAQALIKAMDMLVVFMSNLPSADQPTTLIRDDASAIIAGLALVYKIAQNIGNSSNAASLGTTLAEFDNLFNADGKLDPLVMEGSGEIGDQSQKIPAAPKP